MRSLKNRIKHLEDILAQRTIDKAAVARARQFLMDRLNRLADKHRAWRADKDFQRLPRERDSLASLVGEVWSYGEGETVPQELFSIIEQRVAGLGTRVKGVLDLA